MEEFSEALVNMLRGGETRPCEAGYVNPVAVRAINGLSKELSWYPNTCHRFHEVSITPPKEVLEQRSDASLTISCHTYSCAKPGWSSCTCGNT